MGELATGLVVRRLSYDDLDGALALSSGAGWNQRRDDWRKLLAIAPNGGFAAVHLGRVVGTAIGIDYGAFSWIAMMLVDPSYRGRGLGRRLLDAALHAVPADTAVRLDATPMGRPLYRHYGFEDECALTRCTSGTPVAGGPGGSAGLSAHAVRPMAATDLATVAEHDGDVFGGNRRGVLEWAFELAPEYAHVIEPPGDEVPIQYCLGRQGRLFDQIGPIVAASPEAAEALAGAALRRAGRRAVVMDVFDAHPGLERWLRARGFQPQRPLFRMRRMPRLRRAADPEPLGPDHTSGGRRSASGVATDAPSGHGAARQGPHPARQLLEYAILGPEFA